MARRRNAMISSHPLARRLAPYCVVVFAAVMIALAVIRARPVAAPPLAPPGGSLSAPNSALSMSVPPPVEPLEFVETTRDSAREANAAVPFIPGKIAAARPLVFAGTPTDRARAAICLASAVWYEAGDDAVGERAVAQVVLNRLRHPAFPKTVCGVVFQGSERRTGCQFTFTCDGAMVRTPSLEAWNRARVIADKALAGAVEAPVGTATHYHTDWVVPYWSASLDKIAAVHTHLFFRWRGWWGQPGAFSGRYTGGEMLDPRLLRLPGVAADPQIAVSEEAIAQASVDAEAPQAALPDRDLKGNVARLSNADGTEIALELDPRAYPGSYAIVAFALCKAKPKCTVQGWIRPKRVPAAFPIPPQALRTMSFLYRKDIRSGPDQIMWDCREIVRENKSQCLPGTDAMPAGKR